METLSAPLAVSLGITGACNLRCRHCLAKDTWEREDLSTARLLALIDQLAKAKVLNVGLFGGEPLLRADLWTLLDRMASYPFALSLNTNGTLVTREAARRLVRTYRIGSIVVSYDGTRPAHEALRGPGSFDPLIRGVGHLVREGGDVMLSCTVTRLNSADIENAVARARDLGVRSISFNPVFLSGNAACRPGDVHLTPREERDVAERVHRLRGSYGSFVNEKSYYLSLHRQLGRRKKEGPAGKRFSVPTCPAGTRKCVIRPDGKVGPCDLLWDVTVGDVRRRRFMDIWKHAPGMKAFRRPLKVDLSGMDECHACEYQRICFFGHRCYPYYSAGGIANRDLYCWKASL